MEKILISWMAYTNDFEGSKINADGPTCTMHAHYYEYNKHILLCSKSADDGDTRFEHLVNYIRRNYPQHTLAPQYMSLDDADLINLNIIQPKIETLLLSLANAHIDILVSPGTPAMHTTWHFAHINLGLSTRLLQLRPKKYSKGNKSERIYIDIDKSTVTSGTIIKQRSLDSRESERKYEFTQSIKPIYENAYKIAQTDFVTTLILGESGTGKEHLAYHIHKNSARSNKPFLAINCSAMSDQLLESRLFGHKKGSFTGADKDTEGLFLQANGGTIFLDEIGDISPYMQQALLRVLQEREITPIGEKPKKINVRVIAATNKDLPRLCEENKFRWDLYYRLAVAELELPPLRNRGTAEIKQMINFFIDSKKTLFNKPKKLKFSKDALEALSNYPFPGNVRELENLIERLYVFNDELVELKDLPDRLKKSVAGHTLLIEDVIKEHITKVLKLHPNNKQKVCRLLGMGSVITLNKKIKQYNIDI